MEIKRNVIRKKARKDQNFLADYCKPMPFRKKKDIKHEERKVEAPIVGKQGIVYFLVVTARHGWTTRRRREVGGEEKGVPRG